MKYVRSVFIAALILSISPAQTSRSPQITAAELIEHVKYLASGKLEGRRAGSEGAQLAARYIADEFRSYGLNPLGDNGTFFQAFEFVAGVELGPNNQFKAARETWKLDQDFRPLGFSARGSLMGDLVFVGYGISNPDKNYDDYAGTDVKDKAVLVLRYSPDGDNPHGDFVQQSSLRYKASKAKEMGAKAILVVTGPADGEPGELVKLRYDHDFGNAGILAINISQGAAEKLLSGTNLTLKDVQQKINGAKAPHSLALDDVSLTLSVDLKEIRRTTENVLGLVQGTDPSNNEVLVIGAHYDHLGYGGEGSGSLKPDTVAIHNGADDNASGTAGLLELAQAFSARQQELGRSILFISFSAEELGLLGSANYVKNPVVPLEQTVAMINMDMIGRLHDRKLIVFGIGTSPGFDGLVRKYNIDSTFVLKLNNDGYGPSDHSSFYGKKIPVFHFFTDLHTDYHRPSDDYDKINAQGMESVVRYIEKIVLDLDQQSSRPQYVQTESPRLAGETRGFRTYVGTIPDYSEQSDGMKLTGVREGSPAAKGGLQAGDIMVKFGKVDVKNVYDYTYALGEYKPGDEVEVIVKRGDKLITCVVKLEKRN